MTNLDFNHRSGLNCCPKCEVWFYDRVCPKCKTNLSTGMRVFKIKRKFSKGISLPKIREALPERISKDRRTK